MEQSHSRSGVAGAGLSSTAPTRLLLVDDHGVVTEGLSVLLSRFDDLDIVGTASGGAAAVEQVHALRPDVVVMDLSMPDVDGVEATRRILAAYPETRVLALTAFLDQPLVSAAVNAGASGFLLKSCTGDELAGALRTVAAGGSVLDSQALSLLVAPTDVVGNDLTPRELDVLGLLVHGHSNKQIAAELNVSSGTVRIHVSNILSKLDVENRTAAAHVARTHGLVSTTLGNGEARPR